MPGKTLNQKGQEEAPFELLVAVIIMAFVIFIGLQAMEKLTQEKCYNEANANLLQLRNDLQEVNEAGSSKNLNFHLSTCYNPEKEKTKIIERDDPNICGQLCKKQKTLCLILKYDTGEGLIMQQCVDIAPLTSFPSIATSKCLSREDEGYELIDFKEEIPRGNYQLRNRSEAGSVFPTVCAYRQKQ